MIEGMVREHPQRQALTNELHARPFAPMTAPGRAVMLAFMQEASAAERDGGADRAHLVRLVDRQGGAHPAPGASHYFGDFDRFRLKWEQHTEFVSYTLYEGGGAQALFQPALSRHFPEGWLGEAPGALFAAVQVEILQARPDEVEEKLASLGRHFAGESLACARVLDRQAVALGDFRIHEGGFSRFALIVHGDAGPQRVGRMVQRLFEIETYRLLAMMSLPLARQTSATLNRIEGRLAELIRAVASGEQVADAEILKDLIALSAEIEALSTGSAFRFGAGQAYEAIVAQRIEMIREERLEGRQLFREFMQRRFDPAMRTCRSAVTRLHELAERASRIADLLRTRVDVAVEVQNQRLLESMDRRAALQLRLQETVEGLSVVAISYYAVSLAALILAPLAARAGWDKSAVAAIVALPVIAAVWWFVRRIRRRLNHQQVASPAPPAPPG